MAAPVYTLTRELELHFRDIFEGDVSDYVVDYRQNVIPKFVTIFHITTHPRHLHVTHARNYRFTVTNYEESCKYTVQLNVNPEGPRVTCSFQPMPGFYDSDTTTDSERTLALSDHEELDA